MRLREAVERLIADPALRAETVRSLASCIRSILGMIAAIPGLSDYHAPW